MAEKYSCLFLFLHHTGKRTEDLAPSKNNFVGSQSLEASVRLGIELRVDRMNPELRHLCIVKGNYLGSQYKQSSFVLKMDENFVFSETGDRIVFEYLALNPNQSKLQSKGKQPSDFTEEQHLSFLRKAASEPVSKRKLTSAVMENFTISDQPARKFIDIKSMRGNYHSKVWCGTLPHYHTTDKRVWCGSTPYRGCTIPHHTSFYHLKKSTL